MDVVYLNGQYLPKHQAAVSVMDRGFLFGDGVYEVIPVYNREIFRAEHHLDRLYRSLAGIQLSIEFVKSDWLEIFQALIQRNEHLGTHQSIYLQVTRGAPPDRNHAFPIATPPTIFAFCYPLKTIPLDSLMKGLAAITLEDTRWQHCNIKAISLLPNILLYQEAINHSCVEAILIRNGHAVEGATSNLFIVKNDVIITPPLSHEILGGVTRELVLELAKSQYSCKEEAITEDELFAADEVWITSSTREIYPITMINNQKIQKGLPGPVWSEMIKTYKVFIENL